MDEFDKREDGFERAFASDQALQFRARAHRNRNIAAWAGEKLGLAGEALTEYAAALADRHVTDASDEPLVAELKAALAAKDISEPRIRRRLEAFGAGARVELQAKG